MDGGPTIDPEDHPIFRTSRHPISLPSDAPSHPSRGTTVAVAVATIAAALIAGLSYRVFWSEASNDASRLLPGTTQLYLGGETPSEELQSVGLLDRWSQPKEMSRRLSDAGTSSLVLHKNTAGLPYRSLYELFRRAAGWHVALVPTSGESAVVALVEVPDPRLREQLTRRIQRHFRVVDRILGHDVYGLDRTQGSLPWQDPVLPLHMVELDPFVLMSYGPTEALHDVLEAKVGTTSQPLRAARGYRLMGSSKEGSSLRGFIGAGPLYDALLPRTTQQGPGYEEWRGAWVSEVSSISWTSSVSESDDVLELRLHLTNEIVRSTKRAVHRLIGSLPDSAMATVSLALDEPAKLLSELEEVLRRLHRRVSRPGGVIGLARQLRFFRTVLFEVAKKKRLDIAGEVVFSVLNSTGKVSKSRPRWAALVQLEAKHATASVVAEGIERVLGDRFSYGVRRLGDGFLHLIRPARPLKEGQDVSETLVWRVNGTVLEVGSSMDVLDELDNARLSGTTFDHGDVLRTATRSLHPESSLLALLNPFRGPWAHHAFMQIVNRDLKGSFRLGLSGQFEGSTLVVRSNLGLWTPLASFLTASQSELDELTLRSLSAPCRAAFLEHCRSFPDSVTCHPTNPEREELAREACLRLDIRDDQQP
jgi:hypothetical protein